MCNSYYMPHSSQPLTSVIRRAIRDGGVSFKGLEEQTGVKRQSLMKFARGEQSLRLDIADKLAVYFGLTLVSKGNR